MTKLSDTQRILLSNATQRGNGSLLPLPATMKPGGGTAKAITALIRQSFAKERETDDPTAVHRVDGDINHGIFITPAGAAAIGIDLAGDGGDMAAAPTVAASVTPVTAIQTHKPRASNKSAAVVALLGRTQGATLPELIAATGWLPHTTRAALTGLRKKGHAITRGKRDGVTCYTIVEAA
jgi:hypothetical protein